MNHLPDKIKNNITIPVIDDFQDECDGFTYSINRNTHTSNFILIWKGDITKFNNISITTHYRHKSYNVNGSILLMNKLLKISNAPDGVYDLDIEQFQSHGYSNVYENRINIVYDRPHIKTLAKNWWDIIDVTTGLPYDMTHIICGYIDVFNDISPPKIMFNSSLRIANPIATPICVYDYNYMVLERQTKINCRFHSLNNYAATTDDIYFVIEKDGVVMTNNIVESYSLEYAMDTIIRGTGDSLWKFNKYIADKPIPDVPIYSIHFSGSSMHIMNIIIDVKLKDEFEYNESSSYKIFAWCKENLKYVDGEDRVVADI